MSIQPATETIPYNTHNFPLHLAFLTVGDKMLPWMVISKDPFRTLIAMQLDNHSLTLVRKYQEAAIHFMPWRDRERVVRAGYLSGSFTNKAERLGYKLLPADKLQYTKLVEGADITYETVVLKELLGISHEFAPFLLDVVAVHEQVETPERQPILFMKEYKFATVGESWRFRR